MADRYLLESGAPDGYLLEDGSGVLILESGVAAFPTGPSKFAAPQQISAREVAGYAIFFATAALALSAVPPVGASEYTVGTHQAAIAASQPRPKVWGTVSAPPAAPSFVTRPIIVGPQAYTDLAAYVHGTAPDSVPRPLLKTLVSAPQQTDDPYGKVWGPQPEGIDVPPPTTRVAAPEQRGIAYAKVWGPVPAPLVVVDTPFGRILVAAPEQIGGGYGKMWGPTPAGIDRPPPRTLVSAPEQQGVSYAKLWGPVPAPLVVVDTPVGRMLVAASEQVGISYAKLWGQFPPPVVTVDSPVGRLFTVAPQNDLTQYSRVWGSSLIPVSQFTARTFTVAAEPPVNLAAQVWGQKPASVAPGADVPIGHFAFYFQPFYEPVQFGLHFATPPESVVPPVIPPVVQGGGGGGRWPIDWQGERRKKRLEDYPNLHLKKILDDVVRELYGELTDDDVPEEVQEQAAALVKPFVAKKDRKVAVPQPSAVDWALLQLNLDVVRALIELWRIQELIRLIADDDEFLLLFDS